MKNSRKLLAVLLSLLMLLSLLPAMALAADGYTVSLSASTNSVVKGDTFDVAVKVSSSNPTDTAAALQTIVTYDSSRVEYVSISPSVEAAYNRATGALAVYFDSKTVGGSGATVATLTFRALSAGATGAAVFSVSGTPVVGVSGQTADIPAAAGGGATVAITTASGPLYDITIQAPEGKHTYDLLVNGVKLTNFEARNAEYGGAVETYRSAAREGDTITINVTITEPGYAVGTILKNLSGFSYVNDDRPFMLDGGGTRNNPVPTNDPAYPFPNGSFSTTMRASKLGIPLKSYEILNHEVDSDIRNGTVEVVPTEVIGSTNYATTYFDVTAKPDEGYRLGSIQYSVDGGETWTTITNISNNKGSFSSRDTDGEPFITATFLRAEGVTISTEDELFTFAEAVNSGDGFDGVTVTLANDIELTKSWLPIGKTDASFRGTFEGGGNTISGMEFSDASILEYTSSGSNVTVGFFGRISGGTVRNLSVSGAVTPVYDWNTRTAGIAVYASAGSLIENCKSYVNISNVPDNNIQPAGFLEYRFSAGGIAYSLSSSTIRGCANYGSIGGEYATFQDEGAGIVNLASGSSMVENCVNYGRLRSSSIAGIAGSAANSQITGCTNKGALTSVPNNVTGSGGNGRGSAVGIAVEASGVSSITNCYNTGTITAHADSTYIDGIALAAGVLGGVSAGSGNHVTVTNCYNIGELSRTGSKVGSVPSGARFGEIMPSHTITGGSYIGFNTDPIDPSLYTIDNCYTSAEIAEKTPAEAAAALGGAYKEDANGVNPGDAPLLLWESGEIDTTEYQVNFDVTGSSAYSVTVYTDSARTGTVQANQDGSYSLPFGTYYYKVSAPGRVTEYGSFSVFSSDVTVPVTLQEGAAVTFTVTPSAADFILTGGSGEVMPLSSADGVYTFVLYIGGAYEYTATAAGYNGTTRGYTAADGDSLAVTLTPSGQSEDNPTITGGQTISAGGVYNLGRVSEHHSIITISTTDPVTLVGTGTSLADVYENLFIDCTVAGVNLTLQDLYISNNIGATNLIDFMGADNHLYFAGTSILDMNTGATGYAMLHVGQGAEVTMGGVAPDDTLYFYKSEQGAGIGGNQSEYNGKITINGGNLFMKNSKQGALIGSGANAKAASGSPGDIIINGGTLNLIPISRGAAIGGSAGSAGGATGTNVYIHGGTITINVDYSGSAIGGGGFADGNDSDGGILYYSGGSIRTFIDYNAVDPNGDGSAADTLWPGVTEAGVNDTAITADKVNAGGANVYLLTFDTTRLSDQADSYTVEEGGAVIYSGGRHAWRYINEDLYKADQIPINYTMDNWAPLDDTNLYLYLTGEDHTLIVNGEEFDIRWDSETSTFSFGDFALTPPVLVPDTTGNSVGQAVDVTFPTDAAWEAAISGITVNSTPLTAGQYTVTAGNINIAAGVFTAPGDYSITVTAADYSDAAVTQTMDEAPAPTTYNVTVDGAVSGGSVTVDPVSGIEGTSVTVTVTPAEGKQLVADSLQYTTDGGSTYTAITASEGVYSFVLPAANVVVTAQFEDIFALPRYTVVPMTDESVYEVGTINGGFSAMTVKAGASGLKYFGTQITPVIEHEGKEAVVFVHLRGGVQLSINVTRADFDLLDEAQAGFNVRAGDVVRIFIVDDLTNDTNFNPTILQ